MSDSKGKDPEKILVQAMSDWGPAVYHLALSQTHSRPDAEDIYQEVFLRLFNTKTNFNSDEHLKAWLLRVTINRCRDLARSGWKRHSSSFDPEWDRADDSTGSEDFDAVWDAINQLPESQRIAIHLHYVEGYSVAEIAKVFDRRPATVRTWLFRARGRIKDRLKKKTKTNFSRSSEAAGASNAKKLVLPPLHDPAAEDSY